MSDSVQMQLNSDTGIVRMNVSSQNAPLKMRVSGATGTPKHCETADRLLTPREISLSGSAQGAAMFDGSSDVAIYTSITSITNSELEEILQ